MRMVSTLFDIHSVLYGSANETNLVKARKQGWGEGEETYVVDELIFFFFFAVSSRGESGEWGGCLCKKK